jgi:phenylacetate-CoA ligase
VLGTALAQISYATSVAFGARFSQRALDHLVAAALSTCAEFGEIGAGAGELATGPALDEQERRLMATRRFRAVADRASRETPYYRRLFAELDVDPKRLRESDIGRLPLTTKDDVRADPDAFVAARARPTLLATTTGTTGLPASIAFSAYELRVAVSISALGSLVGGHLDPADVVLMTTSATAVLGNLGLAGACARIGAAAEIAGVSEPAATLSALRRRRGLPGHKSRVSVLSAYPSYLDELVACALEQGLGPADFGLERILLGGEVSTLRLRDRCRRAFGDVDFLELYAMTETIPFGARGCSAGHLHFDGSVGLLEVVEPESGTPARPGHVGALVVTPFPPYREATLLLRYATRDLVRTLPQTAMCELAAMPATSRMLGKQDFAVRGEDGWTTPLALLEALESVEKLPLPIRHGFWGCADGVAVEVFCGPEAGGGTATRIWEALEEWAIPVAEVRVVDRPDALTRPVPLRCDLREARRSLP